MNVFLFGTGAFYQLYRCCFNHVNIVGLLDNDELKQGDQLDGVQIYAPDMVIKFSYDQIYLLSAETNTMRKQLVFLGVQNDIIFEVYDMYRGLGNLLSVPTVWIYDVEGHRRLVNSGEAAGCIAILTPNLSLNGAEIALCQLVKVLKALGEKAFVASLCDGPLRYELQEMNVPVVVAGQSMHEIPLSFWSFLYGAKGIVLNTIEMYLLLQGRHRSFKVFWWLHDSDLVYRAVNIKDCLLKKIDLENIKILPVSEVAHKAFECHFCREIPMDIMPFGLIDWAEKFRSKINDARDASRILNFALIGGIEYRKAQDVLIEAVCKMTPTICCRCRFLLIGIGLDSEFGKKIQLEAQDLSNVVFVGEMNREKLLSFYAENIDVLVCPSREETVSIVTIEAMMFGKPVIVAESVGVSQLIREESSGIIVPTDDPVSLARAMCRLVENPDERQNFGRRARNTYEKYFTIDNFEKRVQKIILSTC